MSDLPVRAEPGEEQTLRELAPIARDCRCSGDPAHEAAIEEYERLTAPERLIPILDGLHAQIAALKQTVGHVAEDYMDADIAHDDPEYAMSILRGILVESKASLDAKDAEIASLRASLEAAQRDSERLNHMTGASWAHSWAVAPQVGGGWVITIASPTGGGDYDEVELARTRGTLREALDAARSPEAHQ